MKMLPLKVTLLLIVGTIIIGTGAASGSRILSPILISKLLHMSRLPFNYNLSDIF